MTAIPWGRVAVALAAVASLAMLHCSGSDYTQEQELACAPADMFAKYVSPLVERRCGTLDCHGSVARPMRLYSKYGLRHPFELNLSSLPNVSGGAGTTDMELTANYSAVCDVDPEPMGDTAKACRERSGSCASSAEKLLVVNKARGLEHHKGGKVVNENDAADACILGWIEFDSEDKLAAACGLALQQLQ